MPESTNGWAVVEHDDTGTIHQVAVFVEAEMEEACQFGERLIREYYDTERGDPPEIPVDHACQQFRANFEWKGFSAAVTLKRIAGT